MKKQIFLKIFNSILLLFYQYHKIFHYIFLPYYFIKTFILYFFLLIYKLIQNYLKLKS